MILNMSMKRNIPLRDHVHHLSSLNVVKTARAGGSMNGQSSVSHLRVLIIISALTSLFLGCGSAYTSTSLSSGLSKCKTQRTHPNQRYLIEYSEGQTISAARDRASAALTRRLNAEIRSEVSVKTVEQSGTQVDDVQESVRVSSHFEHAELIRPLERCERCIEDACSSVVYLNRDELATRLLKSISPELTKQTITDLY